MPVTSVISHHNSVIAEWLSLLLTLLSINIRWFGCDSNILPSGMEWWRKETLLIIEHEHNAYLKCVMITKIHVFCFVGYNHPNIIKAVQDPKIWYVLGRAMVQIWPYFLPFYFLCKKSNNNSWKTSESDWQPNMPMS